MKPQLKPFSAITSEAIWSSATHWMLLYPGKPEAEISADTSGAIMRTWVTPDLQVYPFTYDASTGGITPVLWPVLPGEETIAEWEGWDTEGTLAFDPVLGWLLLRTRWCRQSPETALKVATRAGFNPAPRRRINADGTVTPVWVWEADR